MDGIAVNPAADVNLEPQSMPASSVGACPPIESTSLPDPAHLTDRVSIDVRGLALAIVTTIVVVFALQWAEKFFIPLLLGIIIAYTLNPLVVWLERIKIPRVVGTSIVMLAVLVRKRICDDLAARPDTDHPRSVARSGQQIVCRAPQHAGGAAQHHAESPSRRARDR